jgi:chemotaxis protein CheD
MAVSANEADEIVTHALGSCVGLAIYDPEIKVGGILHFVLPTSTIDEDRAASRPCLFADTGIPLLLEELSKLGAEDNKLVVKVAGGAQITDERGVFNVGRRNHVALRQILSRAGIPIEAEDVGGIKARTMTMDVGSGTVTISSDGEDLEL